MAAKRFTVTVHRKCLPSWKWGCKKNAKEYVNETSIAVGSKRDENLSTVMPDNLSGIQRLFACDTDKLKNRKTLDSRCDCGLKPLKACIFR